MIFEQFKDLRVSRSQVFFFKLILDKIKFVIYNIDDHKRDNSQVFILCYLSVLLRRSSHLHAK